MLYRAAYRALVVTQLVAANTAAGPRVYESRALPIGSELMPAILVQTPRETKRSRGRGAPKFDTVASLVVVAMLEARAYQAAEQAIEALVEQIEMAILANTATVNPLQQFVSVDTEVAIDATGKTVVGEATMTFEVEFPQFYDPAALTLLTQVEIDVARDAVAPGPMLRVDLPR